MTGRPASDEPSPAASVVGAALLAAVVLLFVHAAGSALLTVVAGTVSPGPDVPGGVWVGVIWAVAVAAGAVSTRPIVRRTIRPLAVGVATGVLAAAGYTAIAVGLAGSSLATPLLWGRIGSFVVAGALVGALTRGRAP